MESYNGFYLIEIPIPAPLKFVNCYLTKTSAGWHLIDTGFNTDEAKAAWENAFNILHIAPKDVVEIVLSHFHPDHIGLAGWLQDYTKAPVRISQESKRLIQYLWIDNKEAGLFVEFAHEHGMNPIAVNKVHEYLISFPRYVHPFPKFTTFEEGEHFNWGEDYVAIHTPGHADGHMIFYSSQSGTVLAGDLLLPKITPNVSYFPGFNLNPLQAFFDSLHKLQEYKLETVLPGHRFVYNNGNKRILELIDHHQIRLEETLVLLQETATAQEVSDKLFPRITLDSDPLQLLFALEETLAHLIYLREEGLLKSQTDHKGVTRFSLVKP